MTRLPLSMRTLQTIRMSALCLLVVAAASAPACAATVSVSPVSQTVSVASNFTVDLVTDAVIDLKAYELIVDFDPTIIQLLGATAGDVLTNPGNPFQSFLVPDYSTPADTAWYDAAMLIGNTQGPGTLVHLQFKALSPGTSNVTWRKADFRNSFNVSSLPTQVSGIVHVVGPTASRPTTWSALRALYGPARTQKRP
jgi:hypothetical protein